MPIPSEAPVTATQQLYPYLDFKSLYGKIYVKNFRKVKTTYILNKINPMIKKIITRVGCYCSISL